MGLMFVGGPLDGRSIEGKPVKYRTDKGKVRPQAEGDAEWLELEVFDRTGYELIGARYHHASLRGSRQYSIRLSVRQAAKKLTEA